MAGFGSLAPLEQPVDEAALPPGILSQIASKLSQTWPARLAKDAYGAMKLPGDVYQGNVSMYGDDGRTNPAVIDRAADLGGLVMGGSYAAAPAMKDASGMGIRAYHGSPHDFERFDLSKIGTGEGAQAYGHGLYFAENEGVARGYRDTLSKAVLKTFDGALYNPSDLEHLNVRVAGYNARENLDIPIAKAKEILLSDAPKATREMASRDMMRLYKLKENGGVTNNPGSMYEVNINADPAKFLDWDKPLAAHDGRAIDAILATRYRNSPDSIPRARQDSEFLGRDLGSFMYDLGHAKVAGSPANATSALAEKGIPGIKYLDHGSRGAGAGSSNYVMFDDKLIDIMRKYGIAGLPAAGAAGASFGSLAPSQEGL